MQMKTQELSAKLAAILLPLGFWKRNNAFFRVQGDGVLVILQFDIERNASYPGHPHYVLGLGLCSLYGELLPQHFTSRGCVTQYHVMEVIGERDTLKLVETTRYGITVCEDIEFTPEDQLAVLKKRGIEFIQGITSQEKLLQAICDLDLVDFGEIYWLDMRKYSPLLFLGKYDDAADIIHKHLFLRGIPKEKHSDLNVLLAIARNDFEKEEAHMLHRKLKLAEDGNRNEIEAYLKANYDVNIQRCKLQ